MTPGLAAEIALRDRARKLQSLHVRLLFCLATQRRWTNDPGAVLAEFGLPATIMDRIPDIAGEQFQAESHGRRIGARRSITRVFADTQKELAALAAGRGDEADRLRFDAFFCSDFFLDPKWGLPHASGIGQGYENTSKYFFWLKDGFGLARNDCNIALRNAAYSEFAAFLINEYRRPHDPYFDRFQGGLFWRHEPAHALPVMLLTEEYMLVTISSEDTARQLPEIGLLNLDIIAPPDLPSVAML